jgi:hypothetical protein
MFVEHRGRGFAPVLHIRGPHGRNAPVSIEHNRASMSGGGIQLCRRLPSRQGGLTVFGPSGIRGTGLGGARRSQLAASIRRHLGR